MTLLPEQGLSWLRFVETAASRPGIRIGVAVDERPPAWVQTLLGCLRQLSGIDLVVFSLPSAQNQPSAPLLTALHHSMSLKRCDPLGHQPNEAVRAARRSLDQIRAAGCAVILWLLDSLPAVDPRSLAAGGVFTVRFGSARRAIPFWEEVAAGSATSQTAVYWHGSSFDCGRAVRIAETATSQGFFVSENSRAPVCAAVRMLAELCERLQREGVRFEETALGFPSEPLDSTAPEWPSNVETVRFAASKLARSLRARWSARGKRQDWFVALRRNDGASDLRGFAPVPLPEGVQAMADPFLCEWRGKHYLLFEEIAAGSTRGRLACIEILPDGRAAPMQIALDRPYHLSYPCVIPVKGDLFLLPETSQANRVELYRFLRFPDELELVSTPLENIALTDTTPVFVEGRWYFFTTTPEPFLETVLFSSPRLDGPWRLHPSSPVSSSVRSCRSAGHLFWREGKLFRPTQDCSVRYGYAIVINEVTTLTPEQFEERPAARIFPDWMPGLLATHTWNESSDFQAIDGLRYSL